ncbi:MAG: diguanylate cyclase [Inhella sp.]
MLHPKLTLRTQVALLFGSLVGLVAGGLSWWLAEGLAEQALHDQGTTLQTLATSTAVMFSEGLHERQREVELLAEDPPQGAGLSPQHWQPVLDRLQRSRTHYSWIGLASPKGEVLAASGGLLVGQNVASRPWFQAALSQPYTGDVHAAKLLTTLLPPSATGEPLRFLDFAAPLRDAAGGTIAVLGVHASWDWASEVVNSLRSDALYQQGVRVFVLDRAGQVIHRPRDAAADEAPPHPLPRGLAQIWQWSDGKRYLSAATPVPAREITGDLGWTVVTRQPLARAAQGAEQARRQALLAGALAALLGLLLAGWLAGRFSRPLQRMAEAARRVEAGQQGEQIPEELHSLEVAQLSSALRGMQKALQGREAELEQRVKLRTTELEQAHAELSQANAVLSAMALNDALTGLPNRRAADARLEMEFQRHRRNGQALALGLIDIDRFKSVNDRYGHAGGDEVLQRVARVLAAAVRRTDFLARFGGEEFLVLMPETPQEGARQLAERLRQAVEDSDGPPVKVTLSLGLCCSAEAHASVASALQAADEALYAAKQGGRNRVAQAPAAAAG